MFKKIGDKITYKEWASERYKRLDQFDRLLDGKFYNHIANSFYDETAAQNKYIKLEDRRPSAQYNLCKSVPRKIARKLFSGRHAPRFAHKNEALHQAATALAREGFLAKKLMRAAVWASVGAVCVTFKILEDGAKQKRIVFEVWRAKYCEPTFDELGELKSLRVSYLTRGYNFPALYGISKDDDGKDIAPGALYWHVFDLDTERYMLYHPRPEDAWPPSQERPLKKMADTNQPTPHNYGFVPGHWFVNLTSGDEIDGECLFEPAISTAIDIDYTLSSLGRGVRYNASPEVVLIGKRKNHGFDDRTNTEIVRGPTNVIEMEAAKRDPAGNQIGGGDAKLLEMSGQGIDVGLKYVETLRKLALESIAASRKDPDKIGGPQSGRAMEMLDDDPLDLYDELRTALGENGSLPLTRKAMRAAKKDGHRLLAEVDLAQLDALGYYWPKPYQPGAQELFQLAQGLVQLVTPIPDEHETAPAPATPGADGKPGKPGAAIQTGTVRMRPIMTVDQATLLLSTMVDIPPDVASLPDQQKPAPSDDGNEGSPEPVEPVDADGDDGGGGALARTKKLMQKKPKAPTARARKKKVTT